MFQSKFKSEFQPEFQSDFPSKGIGYTPDNRNFSPFDNSGEYVNEYHAMWNALHDCARVGKYLQTDEQLKDAVHQWLEHTPRATIVKNLIDMLRDWGYRLIDY
jgi:hypothetical protein